VTRYEHTQIGHVVIWALLGASVLVWVRPISHGSPPFGSSLILPAVFLITIALFYKLTIKIDDQILLASFGPGIIHKKVPLTEIVRCEPIRIRWWYGWGIHLTPYGWLHNVSGLDAVAITLRNGRKFALGTDEPHVLADTIRSLIGTR
jgi:hypothetical protein